MDFKKLIEMNEDAESKRFLRILSDRERLSEEARAFIDTIDNDMLIAISKLGDMRFRFFTDPYPRRAYLWDNGMNSLMIIASDQYGIREGRPGLFHVLGGSYGIRFSGNTGVSFVKIACDPEDVHRVDDIHVSPDVWTENNCVMRKFNVPTTGLLGLDCFKFGNKHFSYPDDDCRNWFERAYDALPKFSESFASYLEERAKGVK